MMGGQRSRERQLKWKQWFGEQDCTMGDGPRGEEASELRVSARDWV